MIMAELERTQDGIVNKRTRRARLVSAEDGKMEHGANFEGFGTLFWGKYQK